MSSTPIADAVKSGDFATAHRLAMKKLKAEGLIGTVRRQSVVGDRMTARFSKMLGREVKCHECLAEGSRLNAMSPDTIYRDAPAIARRIVQRARSAKGVPLWVRTAAVLLPALCRSMTTRWIRQACVDALPVGKAKEQKIRSAAEQRKKKRGCGGCKNKKPRPKDPSKVRRKERGFNLSLRQKELYDKMRRAKPPNPDPFTDTPVFHLGVHLYPIVGAWEHHVDKWNEIADAITGRCVIGIVTDDHTSPIPEVTARLHPKFEVHVSGNTHEGENPTFRILQDLMPRGQNDILLYAHGKGVRPHTKASPAVQSWVDLMYRAVLFNRDSIVARMADGFKMFGIFRAYGRIPGSVRYRWHYAGTFFAVRLKHFPGSKVRPVYGGVEQWPGSTYPPEECWCEFMDNSPLVIQYDHGCMEQITHTFNTEWVPSCTRKPAISLPDGGPTPPLR